MKTSQHVSVAHSKQKAILLFVVALTFCYIKSINRLPFTTATTTAATATTAIVPSVGSEKKKPAKRTYPLQVHVPAFNVSTYGPPFCSSVLPTFHGAPEGSKHDMDIHMARGIKYREKGSLQSFPGGGHVLIHPYPLDGSVAKCSAWDVPSGKAMVDVGNNKNGYSEWVVPPAPRRTPDLQVSGPHVFFHSWFPGNYGHFLVDHLPSIAWLREQVTADTKFLLYSDELSQKFMKWFDDTFYQRIVWIEVGQLVRVVDGDLMVLHRGYKNTHTTLISTFHRWSDSRSSVLLSGRKKLPDTIVFHSRSGRNAFHGRVVDMEHEQTILKMIRHAMIKHRTEKLVIFNGFINGSAMTFQQQYELMQSASLLIGPHGTGMCNAVFMAAGSSCANRPKMIEFTCGQNPQCTVHEGGGSLRNAYYLLSTAPWLDYHQVDFDGKKSSDNATFIHLDSFEQALNVILG